MPRSVRIPSASFRLVRRASVALVAAFCVLGTPAQDPSTPPATTPPTADEILTFHAAGFDAADLGRLLDKSGVPTLAAADLDRLAAAGVAAPIVERLRAAAPKPDKKTLTFAEIKALLEAGVGEEGVLAVLSAARAPTLGAEQLLELLRAGASPAVVRAVRAAADAPASRPEVGTSSPPVVDAKPEAPTLEELPRLVERGFSAEAIVKRIDAADAKFDVDAVRLVELSRAGVPPEVLKSVWARRRRDAAGTTAPAPTPVPAPVAETPAKPSGDTPPVGESPDAPASRRAAASAPVLKLHDDAAGGFALLVPEGFDPRRDAKNGNALTSFVHGEPSHEHGLAEAELAVFTYRSSSPDRLVEANLGPSGENFLNRLTASYAARKISVTFGPHEPRRLAGRAAMRARLSTSGADGATHTGELWWLFVGDRTFVLSIAVRTDRTPRFGDALATCLRSFAPIERRTRPAGGEDRRSRATAMAEAWKEAVLNRDFALYESLCKRPGRDATRLASFVALCDRFDDPERRLVLGPVDTFKDGALTEFKLLGGAAPVTTAVRWTEDGSSLALVE